MTDALQLKDRIVSFIESNGPSLPSQVAKETGLSILFASAFLSELYNEKRIKMSYLRIGSSPLYFVSGQEFQLEKFAGYLKNKEKEAFQMLKENKYLEDSKLPPAIRVALREIKDFAIPFKKDEEICWKFFTISDDEIREMIEHSEKQEVAKEEKHEPEKNLDISDNKKEETKTKIVEKKKKEIKKTKEAKSKKQNKKRDENFFNKIKEFLSKKNIEIVDIINFKNDEAKILVRKENSEELLFAFNKKKISEKEILKANKEAEAKKLKYSILSLGGTPKKINDFITAVKNLSEIEKIE